jgi:hypothetical protein
VHDAPTGRAAQQKGKDIVPLCWALVINNHKSNAVNLVGDNKEAHARVHGDVRADIEAHDALHQLGAALAQ